MLVDMVVRASGNLLIASTSSMKSKAHSLVESVLGGEGGGSFRRENYVNDEI